MKKVKKIVGFILIALAVMAFIYSLFYWILNPSLTQMQVLFEVWWIELLALISVFIGLNMID